MVKEEVDGGLGVVVEKTELVEVEVQSLVVVQDHAVRDLVVIPLRPRWLRNTYRHAVAQLDRDILAAEIDVDELGVEQVRENERGIGEEQYKGADGGPHFKVFFNWLDSIDSGI